MKTITYNGSSKVIKRIVELLNRKAPLPLDGGGDPDFGTNGQVLTTDGSGNTSWTTPSGGDSVEWTQIQASGTKIAEIEINGTTTDVYAPNGGGGGGGHTIEDADGTDLTQRANLQFLDAHLADDSVNDRTQIENVQTINDESELTTASDGIYLGTYEDDVSGILDASMVAYGNETVEDALDKVVGGNKVSVVHAEVNIHIYQTNLNQGYMIVATSGILSVAGVSFDDVKGCTVNLYTSNMEQTICVAGTPAITSAYLFFPLNSHASVGDYILEVFLFCSL